MGRIQFSVRDLFWLVLVVAMGAGWWINHQQTTRQLRLWEGRANDLKSHLELNGGIVQYPDGTDNAIVQYPPPVSVPPSGNTAFPVP